MRSKRKPPEGIAIRHTRSCRTRDGESCSCSPTFQAAVWSNRDGKRIRKTFDTITGAKAWRRDALRLLERGEMRAPTPLTLGEAVTAWLDGARAGRVRTRSGDVYKPSAVRAYEQSLRLRVLPALGTARLSDIRRSDVQDLADRMLGEGLAPATIQATLIPLKALYRRAVARGEVALNPTSGLELPAVRGGRDRVASPDEAERLIRALSADDRALWATALYAGLRRGELMALRWPDVDLAAGVIRVERSWDAVEGYIEPKSAVGRRSVPVAAVLRDHLVEHRMTSPGEGLVFGRTPETPFDSRALSKRADTAWEGAKLDRITLHEGRHTFASLMIAAGVNAKALSTYMGHANIAITLDRYGHLMPGNEAEAAGLLDAYLARAGARQSRDNGDPVDAVPSGRER